MGATRLTSRVTARSTTTATLIGAGISALVLAQAIGIVGGGADAFTLANQLPNNIYAIIAGGLLSAVRQG